MSYNYPLRYRTFDQLLDAVRIDFIQYDLTNYIEPQQLIKVAKKINYDLGLRIMMTKEAILEVERGKVKLPDDFYVLNYALLCTSYEVCTTPPQGTWIEEVPVTGYQETNSAINTCTDGPVNCQTCYQPATSCSCSQPQIPTACSSDASFDPNAPYGDNCIKPRRVFMNCKGDCYELVQKVNSSTYHVYSQLIPIKLLQNNETIECDCPGVYLNSPNTAWIKGNFLFTNFQTGKIYISYQGALEDEEGNLLIPDHDMINEYYEYSIKQRILENLVMNDEPVGKKLELVEMRLRGARNYALSIVNTPNFSEMKRMWQANRNAQYAKYYNMFKSGNLFLGWNTNYHGSRVLPY